MCVRNCLSVSLRDCSVVTVAVAGASELMLEPIVYCTCSFVDWVGTGCSCCCSFLY